MGTLTGKRKLRSTRALLTRISDAARTAASSLLIVRCTVRATLSGEEEEKEEAEAEEDAKPFRLFFSELCALSPTAAGGVAKASWEAGDVMRLPSSHLFGAPNGISQVYVRQCYVDLANIILSQGADPTARAAQEVILGTPGIGQNNAQLPLQPHSASRSQSRRQWICSCPCRFARAGHAARHLTQAKASSSLICCGASSTPTKARRSSSCTGPGRTRSR